MRRPLVLVVLACLLIGAAVAPAAQAGRKVPQGFMGMFVNRPILGSSDHANVEFNRMVSSGVESTRVAFDWATAQPYRTFGEVPAYRWKDFTPDPLNTSVPTDFTKFDDLVRLNAARGLKTLPVVLDAPRWASYDPERGISHPNNNADYGRFMKTLIGRYGPNGTFWTLNPDVQKNPIREWQVWNEPNIPYFWPGKWQKPYKALLKVAHDAIKQADPHARVILAGFSNAAHAQAWTSLDQFYKLGGTRGLFDVVTSHPYTLLPKNVLKIAKLMRTVMNRRGDRRKPQMLTELSWPSTLDRRGHNRSAHNYGFNVSERTQAKDIGSLYPMLLRYRRSLNIERTYWYTWVGTDRGRDDPFDYAGLRTAGSSDSRAKPAYGVWRHIALTFEGCRNSKSSVTRCG